MGHGPQVVFLHGWATHSGVWHFIAEKLAQEFSVTLVDLPGFGRSKILQPNTIETMADEIFSEIQGEAIYVGWSLGGIIATKIAQLYPHHVQKLVCVASSPKFVKDENWPGIDQQLLHKFSEQLQVDYENTISRFLLLQFYGTSQYKENFSKLQQNLFIHGQPNLEALNNGLSLLQTVDLRRTVAQLCCPILYLLGKLDAIVPAKLCDAVCQLNPLIRATIIPKASHALFLSNEFEFLTTLKEFCHE